ncbi:MAG: SUMF1/EgtB/PvdO family nonheme iron enzyme [Planctomycetes bacterium]|nr:SUMF1/EgtB/PvdO family nonheme iron enzyme [Planctomycetota bacterium]
MTGKIVTFYSYKGGSGRTFLLANVGWWLAMQGFRVLCVDWDLEAPGLARYFPEEWGGRRKSGLVDLLKAAHENQPIAWKQEVRPIKVADRQELALLDAGGHSGADYARALAELPWSEMGRGTPGAFRDRLQAMVNEWRQEYDFVLVDSRTGFTDCGTVCTSQIPDVLVLVIAPNTQGLEGGLEVVERVRRHRHAEKADAAPLKIVPVPSRWDNNSPEDPKKWLELFEARLDPVYREWCDKDTDVGKLLTLLRIPYISRWSFGEPLPVRDEPGNDSASISYAMITVASLLARDFQNTAQLTAERESYVREVIEKGRGVLASAEATPQFRFDLFLSFSSPQRDLARAVAAELKLRGRNVFFDERSLVAGSPWPDGLAQGVREARGVVALLGTRISTWQRAEVEAFIEKANEDSTRFVIPVWLEALPDWPELVFQGFAGRGQSPAELASSIHNKLELRERPEPPVAATPAVPSWTPESALESYRAWVQEQHARLVPYFDGASQKMLENVCIALEFEPTVGKREEMLDPQAAETARASNGKPGALQDLLLSSAQRRWVIVGEPGAGKTTTLRALAVSLAKAQVWIPIFLPLARLAKPPLDPIGFALHDMLGEEQHSARGRALREALLDAQRGGRLVILLDGLDEYRGDDIDKLLEALVSYASAPERSALPIALTSRHVAFERRETPAGFRRAKVLALNEEQQKNLASKFLGPREAERMRRHLQARPALAELARSPLLLTLLCVVARDTLLSESALPATRGKLYKTVIDLLLRRGFGVEKRGVADTVPARTLLQRLSFRLHDLGGESWEFEELSRVLGELRQGDPKVNFLVKETKEWGSNDAFLKDIGYHAGVLGPHDSEHLPWRYLHRSLREFLAAEELATRPQEEVRKHLAGWVAEEAGAKSQKDTKRSDAKRPKPERWGEVYALLCGLVDNPTTMVKALQEASPEIFLRSLPSIDALEPQAALDLLLPLDGWDADALRLLLAAWALPDRKAVELLQFQVKPGRSTHSLGVLWHSLECLGAPPVREEFFRRCERPLAPKDLLGWVEIPAGEFQMGSPKRETGRYRDEGPQLRRTVDAFQLAKAPVTRAQYRRFDPKKEFTEWKDAPASEQPLLPATNVSWFEAKLFCAWLGATLPSEAQWEYACRAGSTTAYSFGDDVGDLAQYAWFVANSGPKPLAADLWLDTWQEVLDHRLRPHRVGAKESNRWGLHDLHGNVWEWCEDTWHANYEGAPTDGRAWGDELERRRVIRGGSFRDTARLARSAYRGLRSASSRYVGVGFRPARLAPHS